MEQKNRNKTIKMVSQKIVFDRNSQLQDVDLSKY